MPISGAVDGGHFLQPFCPSLYSSGRQKEQDVPFLNCPGLHGGQSISVPAGGMAAPLAQILGMTQKKVFLV